MNNHPQVYDVIIAGAGYAGLMAARELHRQGLSIRVLEARDRLGGRVHTRQLDADTYVDLGGQWIGPGQDRVYALAREYSIDTFRTYETGKSTLLFNGKHRTYRGLIPPLPLPALLNLDYAIKKINRMATRVPLARPWETPGASELDRITLTGWMNKHLPFAAARTFFRIASETIFACDPGEISLLQALFYIKSGKDLDTLINIGGGAQQDRFVGGAQQLADRMAEEFHAQIELASPVRAIIHEAEGVRVVSDTGSFQARRVIIALPPVLAARIDYQPAMPSRRVQFWQKWFMGSVIKAYAIYDRPFWRAHGLNGLAVGNQGYAQVTFDNSPADGKAGMLMGFVAGNQARVLQDLPEAERGALILREFAAYFGEEALEARQYLDKSWADEAWSQGCYVGHPAPNTLSVAGELIRRPEGRIHWAGTETAEAWNGYIEGAIRSGERAAQEVLEALTT
jgi:monoamine oxidase